MQAPRTGLERTGRMSSRSPLIAAFGALASTSGVATRTRAEAPATIAAAITMATSLNMYAPCIFFRLGSEINDVKREFSIVRTEEPGTIRDRKPILRFRTRPRGLAPAQSLP